MNIKDIKFKAKRLDNGEWVEGDLVRSITPIRICSPHSEFPDIPIVHKVDTDTICMFTGLKDCKGNEIWEGDIVDVRGVKAEVIWNQEALAFMVLYEYETEPITYLAFINRHSNVLVLHSKFDKEK